MDGIDWITVVEIFLDFLGAVLIGCIVPLPPISIVVALALLERQSIGFAPFNRPVARLFLGDVGSLPVGLLLFWLLLQIAAAGYLAAAILLPFYYLADATVTLLRRAARGERVTQAHRSHYYQEATTRGFPVPAVLRRIAAVNGIWIAFRARSSAWQQRQHAGNGRHATLPQLPQRRRRLLDDFLRGAKTLMWVLVTGSDRICRAGACAGLDGTWPHSARSIMRRGNRAVPSACGNRASWRFCWRRRLDAGCRWR